MRFFHISDLHIGKKLREKDISDDQVYILKEIIRLVDDHKPDGVLIAGDVYDRSVPPASALNIFNDFITELETRDVKVFIISGNHDSPDRLQFAKDILSKSDVYIAGSFDGHLDKVTMEDEYGKVNVYMLPFIKPSSVANFYKDEVVDSYDKALRLVIDSAKIDTDERNILISHQFVTNLGKEPETSESESVRIGGLDNIEVSALDSFDYVALGHLHKPQKVGRETVRYCGTPLKYSFSEANHTKSVTMVSMEDKGKITINKLPLTPLKDMYIIKDTLDNLLQKQEYTQYSDQYIYAIITDEEDLFDPIGQLRSIYDNILLLEIENRKSQYINDDLAYEGDIKEKDPLELFKEFYFLQNNEEISDKQENILMKTLDQLGGEPN